jgi:hypothetical protein
VHVVGEQDAELVSAKTVCPAVVCCDCELRAQARQQQIALGVTKRVVVGLEAIEIEERESGRAVLVEGALKVCEQLTPVGQASQRIVACLLAQPDRLFGEQCRTPRGEQPVIQTPVDLDC